MKAFLSSLIRSAFTYSVWLPLMCPKITTTFYHQASLLFGYLWASCRFSTNWCTRFVSNKQLFLIPQNHHFHTTQSYSRLHCMWLVITLALFSFENSRGSIPEFQKHRLRVLNPLQMLLWCDEPENIKLSSFYIDHISSSSKLRIWSMLCVQNGALFMTRTATVQAYLHLSRSVNYC